MKNKTISVIICLGLSFPSFGAQLRTEVQDFFTSGTKKSIPSEFWQKESNNSYAVVNMSEIIHTEQWKKAFSGYKVVKSSNGGPSFTEYKYDRQCPAFAKVASGTTSGTSSWKRGDPVITNEYVSYDISYKYSGKMIAYFGLNPKKGEKYSKQSGNPNHVGFFLNFVYDDNRNPSKIVGFWMLDQNWGGGTGEPGSPSNGVIRKHLIMLKGYGRNNAKNYYVID